MFSLDLKFLSVWILLIIAVLESVCLLSMHVKPENDRDLKKGNNELMQTKRANIERKHLNLLLFFRSGKR